jgi:hypothetical protein
MHGIARALLVGPVTVGTAPNSHREAKQSDEYEEWKAACDGEIESLHKNRTWSLVPRPTHKNVVLGGY